MSSANGKDLIKGGDDVTITYEDQKNINKFAQLNAKIEDIKDELKAKQNDIKNLEEACDELSLMDEDEEKVPYLVGDIFICQTVGETMEHLEVAKTQKKNEIKELESKSDAIKNQMITLKAHLYGKFANKINLENEDD